MRFASLGSGSRGNATLIEAGATLLLMDCGFSVRETERRLAGLDRTPEQISGLLVTHEHGDHVRGIAPLARKYRLPVWLTHGTWQVLRDTDLPDVRFLGTDQPVAVNDLQVQPFTVPHDAREPCQFCFTDGARRLGVLTDTGRETAHILDCLAGCDALVLECNHDSAMLVQGSYSSALKQRVGGPLGHLSNEQAGALLSRLDLARLQHLVAAHLSEQNNRPELVRSALSRACGCPDDWPDIAAQDTGLGWREIV